MPTGKRSGAARHPATVAPAGRAWGPKSRGQDAEARAPPRRARPLVPPARATCRPRRARRAGRAPPGGEQARNATRRLTRPSRSTPAKPAAPASATRGRDHEPSPGSTPSTLPPSRGPQNGSAPPPTAGTTTALVAVEQSPPQVSASSSRRSGCPGAPAAAGTGRSTEAGCPLTSSSATRAGRAPRTASSASDVRPAWRLEMDVGTPALRGQDSARDRGGCPVSGAPGPAPSPARARAAGRARRPRCRSAPRLPPTIERSGREHTPRAVIAPRSTARVLPGTSRAPMRRR